MSGRARYVVSKGILRGLFTIAVVMLMLPTALVPVGANGSLVAVGDRSLYPDGGDPKEDPQ
jgi:hypothetical protein